MAKWADMTVNEHPLTSMQVNYGISAHNPVACTCTAGQSALFCIQLKLLKGADTECSPALWTKPIKLWRCAPHNFTPPKIHSVDHGDISNEGTLKKQNFWLKNKTKNSYLTNLFIFFLQKLPRYKLSTVFNSSPSVNYSLTSSKLMIKLCQQQ